MSRRSPWKRAATCLRRDHHDVTTSDTPGPDCHLGANETRGDGTKTESFVFVVLVEMSVAPTNAIIKPVAWAAESRTRTKYSRLTTAISAHPAAQNAPATAGAFGRQRASGDRSARVELPDHHVRTDDRDECIARSFSVLIAIDERADPRRIRISHRERHQSGNERVSTT